jgi:hypothetical protein
MKYNFVAAIAKAIMRVQDRFVLIGVKAPALCLFRAQQAAEFGYLLARPASTFALHSVNQGAIAQKQVVTRERRDLILRKLVFT